jgi:prevent-host-death family protein
VIERSAGVEQARARLGQLADDVSSRGEPIFLTRRGQPIDVLVSPSAYGELVEARRQWARENFHSRLAEMRERGAAAGLDVSIVEEAIAAARAIE